MPSKLLTKTTTLLPWYAWLVCLIGMAVRIYAGIHTHIINPDGVLYLYQAKALVSGQLEAVSRCGLSALSIYPVLIAFSHPLLEDLELTARCLSILFGSATSIPLFLLLKRFCKPQTAAVATLIYAFTPVFVSRSADVVRDPVAWFFLCCGMLFFILHHDSRPRIWLPLSCLFLLMAAWARIESGLFVAISVLALFIDKDRKRGSRIAWFLLPVLLVALMGLAAFGMNAPMAVAFERFIEVAAKIPESANTYAEVRAQLKALVAPLQTAPLRFFLAEARSNAWTVALGTLLNRVLEGYFYPYIILYGIGLMGLRRRMREDFRMRYFVLAVTAGFILLYLHVLRTWILEYRFLAIVILPSIVFAACGIDRVLDWLNKRWSLQAATGLIVMGLLIVGVALPKNLVARGENKVVFKQIGEFIRKQEKTAGIVTVAGITTSPAVEWVGYYANRSAPTVYCPRQQWSFSLQKVKPQGNWVNNLRAIGVGYLLLEADRWAIKKENFDAARNRRWLTFLGKWQQPDVGELRLYKVPD